MIKQKYADIVFYLDFDGVLHDSEVYVSRRRGIELRTPERTLFEWMPILEKIMNPYPEVAIVLSTSWVRARSFDFAKAQLSPALQRRVIGATYHRREMNKHVFPYKPRWQQILDDVNRRKPQSWVALDDDVEGWPEELLPHLIATQGSEGVSASSVQQELVDWFRNPL